MSTQSSAIVQPQDGFLREIRVGDCCSSFQFYENMPVTMRLEKHGEDYTYMYKHDADPDWTVITTRSYPGIPTYCGSAWAWYLDGQRRDEYGLVLLPSRTLADFTLHCDTNLHSHKHAQ